MRKFIRIAFFAITVSTGVVLCVASMSLAQTNAPRLHAADLFPMHSGNYLAYDEYPTDTNGVATTSTPTHAATNVISDHGSFDGIVGVAVISDSTSEAYASADRVASVRYASNAAGDVEAFADQNFLALFAPPSVTSSVAAPDSFVNYIALSQGLGVPYHILSLSQQATYKGFPLTIAIDLNGECLGTERVSVPAGEFDTAYHFVITADLKALLHDQVVTELVSNEDVWLVAGVGIVKTNTPTAANPFITVPGVERVMTAHENDQVVLPQAVGSRSTVARGVALYPNPASTTTTLQLPENLASQHSSIGIYSTNGTLIQTVEPSGAESGSVSIETNGLSSGNYFVSIQSPNAKPLLVPMTVSH